MNLKYCQILEKKKEKEKKRAGQEREGKKENQHQNCKTFSGLVVFCSKGTNCCFGLYLESPERMTAVWPQWQVRPVILNQSGKH